MHTAQPARAASPRVQLCSSARQLAPAAAYHNPQPQAQQVEHPKGLAQAAAQQGLLNSKQGEQGSKGCYAYKRG